MYQNIQKNYWDVSQSNVASCKRIWHKIGYAEHAVEESDNCELVEDLNVEGKSAFLRLVPADVDDYSDCDEKISG